MNHKPFVIAHRGFSGSYPENTLLSISEASKIGADIIEFDVQLTKDKEVITFHDLTVERILLSEPAKRISDYTLEQLKQKDFGSWLNKKFNSCKITTLEELLKFKKETTRKFDYIIEIKDRNYEEIIPKVKDLLADFDFSFSNGYLSVRDEKAFNIAIDNSIPRENIGLMQKKRTPSEAMELAMQMKVRYLQLRSGSWTEKNWLDLKNTKLFYTIFIGNTEEDFRWMVRKEPYGIFTNFPNKLVTYISEK